ncbi:MAG: hypothetical protein ACRDTZ_05375 [Pseudonocardiaceae bacterium]
MFNDKDKREEMAAVQADDTLLNSLSGLEANADLVRALSAWRRDVDADSIGEMPELDSALADLAE